jgi:RimJ/RimL family protein N-acetyltransferase
VVPSRPTTVRLLKLGLRVLSTNQHAIGLYRRHGFVEEGRLRDEIRLPDGSYADDVWMALALV